ncbi:MAG: DUF952 domain-containing protein [Thermoflexales bacterium]
MILHLTPRAEWERAPADQPYRPASLEQEGFVHATCGEELMLAVANRFYHQQPGSFVALEIDETRLTSPLRWEPPAPLISSDEGETLPNALFPHIYGPINREAIVGVQLMLRDPVDGRFIGYKRLT